MSNENDKLPAGDPDLLQNIQEAAAVQGKGITLPDTISDLLTQLLLNSPQAQAMIMVHLEAKGYVLTDGKLTIKAKYILQI